MSMALPTLERSCLLQICDGITITYGSKPGFGKGTEANGSRAS